MAFFASLPQRSRRDLLTAAPAFLALIGIAVFALVLTVGKQEDIEARYKLEGNKAFEQKKFDIAEICYRRLSSTDLGPANKFQLARVCLALGEQQRAAALLKEIAPDDRGGYSPAHLLRAQLLMGKAVESPSVLSAVEVQLGYALKQNPESLEAHILLGNLYCGLGRHAEAESHLLLGIKTLPGLRLLLVNGYAARGDFANTSKMANEILNYYLPQAEGIAANEFAILACGQAYLHLKEYEKAVGILRRGLSLNGTAVRESLAGAYVAWVESLNIAVEANRALRVRLLEEGLKFAPSDLRLLQPLVEMTNLSGAESAQSRALLECRLIDGPPSATVHMLLGLEAWKRGKKEEASTHLEQAYKLEPGAGVVANNLAWMLANSAAPDLLRALALADSAVGSAPQNPHFRDTRGKILIKLERCKESLLDLELAQRGLPNEPSILLALAEAYEKLGQSELANRYRSAAKSKEKQKPISSVGER